MNATQHLSDEQFYALLEQPAGNPHLGHLDSCAQCRSELASVQASLSRLRGALTQMASETHLLAFDRPILAAPVARFGMLKHNTLAAGFAAVLVVAAGSLAMLHPGHATVHTPVAAPQVALSDEALLEGINQDLSTSVPPTLAPLTVTDTASATARQR